MATKQPSKLETLVPISGAALVTAAVTYPLDVLRALKMASASGPGYSIGQFIRVHGVKGVMTQGLFPEIARATWMRILKFFFFPITFELLWHKKTSQGSGYEKGLAGALAVIPEVLTITSLELAKIGLQLDSEKRFNNSTLALWRVVYNKYGFAGLMNGWFGVQLRQSLWTGTYFSTLDYFKNKYRGWFTTSPVMSTPTNVNLFAGFCAGAVGAVVNTPFDVVRTNLQKQFLTEMNSGRSLSAKPMQYAFSPGPYFRVMGNIAKTKGVGALYSGVTQKLMHMGASGAAVAVLIPVFANACGMDPNSLM